MITISLTAIGDFQVTQGMTSPAVYLDHWALRLISEDDGFSARFAAGLEAHGGTLALSWVNLVEFARVTAREPTGQDDGYAPLRSELGITPSS